MYKLVDRMPDVGEFFLAWFGKVHLVLGYPSSSYVICIVVGDLSFDDYTSKDNVSPNAIKRLSGEVDHIFGLPSSTSISVVDFDVTRHQKGLKYKYNIADNLGGVISDYKYNVDKLKLWVTKAIFCKILDVQLFDFETVRKNDIDSLIKFENQRRLDIESGAIVNVDDLEAGMIYQCYDDTDKYMLFLGKGYTAYVFYVLNKMEFANVCSFVSSSKYISFMRRGLRVFDKKVPDLYAKSEQSIKLNINQISGKMREIFLRAKFEYSLNNEFWR